VLSDRRERRGDSRQPGRFVTIADQIFAQVRKEIVEGRIRQGSKISEPELARRYGISRGPLREAMRRLESSSLVTRRANVGARVITLSLEQLLEIYQVRAALEGMAARLAAEHMPDAEIAGLQALIEQQRGQVALEQGRACLQREGDLDFHYRIVRGSHNATLEDLLCNDLYHLVRMYRCQFAVISPRAPAALREHGHILEAIAERDGELAEILMRRHIQASRRHVERRLLGGVAAPTTQNH
jgi:DNA-binding GntR family transcriptional regulator